MCVCVCVGIGWRFWCCFFFFWLVASLVPSFGYLASWNTLRAAFRFWKGLVWHVRGLGLCMAGGVGFASSSGELAGQGNRWWLACLSRVYGWGLELDGGLVCSCITVEGGVGFVQRSIPRLELERG